ncbi:hypothetical protein ColTof4_14371 [Colletotrichum tofieldiae]|nr:hypothetical protein ColTof4_14371 [Colletotrichum tofieldiae]
MDAQTLGDMLRGNDDCDRDLDAYTLSLLIPTAKCLSSGSHNPWSHTLGCTCPTSILYFAQSLQDPILPLSPAGFDRLPVEFALNNVDSAKLVFEFDPAHSRLRLKMPSPVHEYFTRELTRLFTRAATECDLDITEVSTFGVPILAADGKPTYLYPDAGWLLDDADCFARVALEVAYSQSQEDVAAKCRKYLSRSGGHVRAAIAIKVFYDPDRCRDFDLILDHPDQKQGDAVLCALDWTPLNNPGGEIRLYSTDFGCLTPAPTSGHAADVPGDAAPYLPKDARDSTGSAPDIRPYGMIQIALRDVLARLQAAVGMAKCAKKKGEMLLATTNDAVADNRTETASPQVP